MDRKVIAAIGVAAVGLVALLLVWGRGQQARTAADVAPVETAVVRKDTLEVTVDATGDLAPTAETALAFQVGGHVADVLAQEGDLVAEGQPLAVLDTKDLTLQWRAAVGSRDAAGSAVAGARSAQGQVQAGASQIDVDIAKVNVDKARDARWGAQAQRDGLCGRVEHKQAAQDVCDGAESAVLQAEDAVRLAELQLEKANAGAEAADVSIARSKVSQAGGQFTSAQSQVDQAKLRLEQATLVSPLAGTVTSLTARVGQPVGVGQAVATISDLSHLIVEVALEQSDVARVVVGQQVKVTVDAFPDSVLTGEVTWVAPIAEVQSGVVLYPVKVRLDPAKVLMRSGMTADVSIVIERKAGALIVPRMAIQSEGSGYFVQIVKSGQPLQKVTVTLGATTEVEAEVLTGLEAGDVVAVAPPPTRVPSGPFGGGG